MRSPALARRLRRPTSPGPSRRRARIQSFQGLAASFPGACNGRESRLAHHPHASRSDGRHRVSKDVPGSADLGARWSALRDASSTTPLLERGGRVAAAGDSISFTFLPKASISFQKGFQKFQSVSKICKKFPRIWTYQWVTGERGPKVFRARRKPRRGRRQAPRGGAGGRILGGVGSTGCGHSRTPSIFR